MNEIEKIAILAETLDEKIDSLTVNTPLESLGNWDSMTKLSLIVLFDGQLGKVLTADQIKSFKTIGDIVKEMD